MNLEAEVIEVTVRQRLLLEFGNDWQEVSERTDFGEHRKIRRLRIPGDGDQHSELMSITIPK